MKRGELVIVIGKRVHKASKEKAREAIFGLTCGNDVSERQWQMGPNHDRQWWRAKGCDTFGVFGPVIVTGLDGDNLKLQTRLNGEVVQAQTTSDLIFDCATMVSFASQYMTIQPGDIIYTGTPVCDPPHEETRRCGRGGTRRHRSVEQSSGKGIKHERQILS